MASACSAATCARACVRAPRSARRTPDNVELGCGHHDVSAGRSEHHGRPIAVAHDRRRGPYVTQDVRELAFGVGGVHGDHHQARPQRGDVDDHGFQRRRRAPHDPVSWPEAETGQVLRPSPCHLVELGRPAPRRPGAGPDRGTDRGSGRGVEEQRRGRVACPCPGPGPGQATAGRQVLDLQVGSGGQVLAPGSGMHGGTR